MTNREFLTAVAAIENVPADIKEHAEAAIAKMDATNEARKNKPSKKATENAPIIEQIYNEILSGEAMPASVVAEAAGISVQKANALLGQMVKAGQATSEDVKVPKKGTIKAYTKVVVEA